MSGNTRKNQNKESVEVSPIVDKMVENRLGWFGHIERKSLDYVVRRVYRVERIQTTRGRGRPRNTIREVIKKDIKINNLDRSMVMDITSWQKLTHVDYPT